MKPCPTWKHPAMTDGMQESYYWYWECELEHGYDECEGFI